MKFDLLQWDEFYSIALKLCRPPSILETYYLDLLPAWPQLRDYWTYHPTWEEPALHMLASSLLCMDTFLGWERLWCKFQTFLIVAIIVLSDMHICLFPKFLSSQKINSKQIQYLIFLKIYVSYWTRYIVPIWNDRPILLGNTC